jgi:hypothetical protein
MPVTSRDRPGQSAALPLARVAAAVKAGDNMDNPGHNMDNSVHDPKEQRIWKRRQRARRTSL